MKSHATAQGDFFPSAGVIRIVNVSITVLSLVFLLFGFKNTLGQQFLNIDASNVPGVMEYATTRMVLGDTVHLDNHWLCLKGRLVDPDDVASVPTSAWKPVRFASVENFLRSVDWFGPDSATNTYQARILLPKSNEVWSVHIQHPGVSIRLFANGSEVTNSTSTARIDLDNREMYGRSNLLVHAADRELRLVLQATGRPINFSAMCITFGSAAAGLKDRIVATVADAVVAFTLFILSLFMVLQRIGHQPLNRFDHASLFYAGYAMALCVSLLTRSECLLQYVFPTMNPRLFVCLRIYGDIVACCLLFQYLNRLEKGRMEAWRSFIAPALVIPVVLVALFNQPQIDNVAWVIFMISGCMLLLGSIVKLIRVVRAYQFNGWMITLGVVASVGTFVCTILSSASLPLQGLIVYTHPIFVVSQFMFITQIYTFLRRELRNNQIAALQSEIKPHFLLNTMATLRSLCRTDPRSADRLIENLSLLLREKMQHHDMTSTHPLGDELMLVRAQVSICSARFGNRVRYEEDLVSMDEDVPVPSLCIQPLVENAILHGILAKEEGGLVRVVVRLVNHDLLICVEDNGVGFAGLHPGQKATFDNWLRQTASSGRTVSPRKVTDLRMDRLSTAPEPVGSIGMRNLNERLEVLRHGPLMLERTMDGTTMLSFTLRHVGGRASAYAYSSPG